MRDHSGFGWLALIVSILLVLLGIATFIWPEAALESFVMVYGVLAVESWTLRFMRAWSAIRASAR